MTTNNETPAGRIKREVAKKYRLRPEILNTRSRNLFVTRVRFEAIYRMRNEIPIASKSLVWIGKQFGPKPIHHTSVMAALKRYPELVKEGYLHE